MKTIESAAKMDESAVKMDEFAAKMDEFAAKMDEFASKMDESAVKMDESAADLRNLLRQQAAVAGFGSLALRQSDLMSILKEAARVCAEVFSAPFCNICRYRSEENDLLIEAGFGWQEGVVGQVVSPADESSPQGRAFVTGEPSICKNLREDKDFKLPPFYAAHGIVSTIDVVIKGDERAYGVLEIASDVQHDFDLARHRIPRQFRQCSGGGRRHVGADLGFADDDQPDGEPGRRKGPSAGAEECSGRGASAPGAQQLQLVYTMLSKLLSDTADQAGQRGIKSVARRVSTLAQVYDHLHGDAMTRTMDFAFFVKSLCLNLAEIQEALEQCHHADLRKRRDHPRSRHGDDAGPCRHRTGHQLLRTRISERQGVGQRVRAKRRRECRYRDNDHSGQRRGLHASD